MTGDLFASPARGRSGPGDAAAAGANRATSLASIYHARKCGEPGVNLLKRQFQTQVERVIHDRGQVREGRRPIKVAYSNQLPGLYVPIKLVKTCHMMPSLAHPNQVLPKHQIKH